MEEGQTNGHGQIYGLMTKILAEVEAIGKSRKNQEQNYAFRGIDDVYNMIHPLFAKHGVFMLPRVLSEESAERPTRSGGIMRFAKLTMAYDFYAADGSHVTVETVGEAMDTADKASNKAMSAAHKYGLLQTFCIPTGSTPDADYNTPEEVVGEPRPTSKSSTASEKCNKCGSDMWDNSTSKRNPKAPDYKCKNKSCDGAVWLQKTEGFGTDAALRDELFAQAEKFMIAKKYPEEKRKEALGRLVALTTEEMGKAVDKLVTGGKPDADARGKTKQLDGGTQSGHVEDERQKKLQELISHPSVKAGQIKEYCDEHFNGTPPERLSLDALIQMYDEIVIPF